MTLSSCQQRFNPCDVQGTALLEILERNQNEKEKHEASPRDEILAPACAWTSIAHVCPVLQLTSWEAWGAVVLPSAAARNFPSSFENSSYFPPVSSLSLFQAASALGLGVNVHPGFPCFLFSRSWVWTHSYHQHTYTHTHHAHTLLPRNLCLHFPPSWSCPSIDPLPGCPELGTGEETLSSEVIVLIWGHIHYY